LKRIRYAHLDSHMQRGIVMHEVSKPRDASVEGLMGLSPDRVDWRNRIVHEAKGSAGAGDAVARQTALYALMLWRRTRTSWRAANDILSQKRTREIDITADLVERMVHEARALSELKRQAAPPEAVRKPICEKCSYRFLCGFA
jgi:CRISPR-associated exonuclease Cas4